MRIVSARPTVPREPDLSRNEGSTRSTRIQYERIVEQRYRCSTHYPYVLLPYLSFIRLPLSVE